MQKATRGAGDGNYEREGAIYKALLEEQPRPPGAIEKLLIYMSDVFAGARWLEDRQEQQAELKQRRHVRNANVRNCERQLVFEHLGTLRNWTSYDSRGADALIQRALRDVVQQIDVQPDPAEEGRGSMTLVVSSDDERWQIDGRIGNDAPRVGGIPTLRRHGGEHGERVPLNVEGAGMIELLVYETATRRDVSSRLSARHEARGGRPDNRTT